MLADFPAALDLRDVTLVHSDWGGGLFLTALGLDERVGAMVILPCEAFDNFPPGLPGRMARIAAALPGGLTLAARQIRVGRLRRTPMLFGWMTREPIPDAMARDWTEPFLRDPGVRRDLAKYGATDFDDSAMIDKTEALSAFAGDVVVLWTHNRVMPPAHGRRLADLIPGARYDQIEDAAVLVSLDQPQVVGGRIGEFLRQRQSS